MVGNSIVETSFDKYGRQKVILYRMVVLNIWWQTGYVLLSAKVDITRYRWMKKQ